MSATDLLQKMGETLGSTATVKTVFGEPIHVNGKTVVPVAKVAYAFGGGFGQGKNSAHAERQGEGGGGGGGVRAYPAGALEVRHQHTVRTVHGPEVACCCIRRWSRARRLDRHATSPMSAEPALNDAVLI